MGSSVICAVRVERAVAIVGSWDDDVRNRGQAQVALGAADEVATLTEEAAALRAERDALQQRIDDYWHRLQNLTQTRDEFIAAASHELKSPLTSILGGA